ncbi:MAG: FGGY family carbohydrate kinase [Candidatus Bathyarchaeota archaeon]|nr:FGGY family carbohydrate kinase [Candidatus Bathyarchaeota archaeon]
MDKVIAAFDIGKSNKKFIVFSDDLKPIYSESTRIDEVKSGGILCDDAESIVSWMKDRLSHAARKWRIKAMSVATFGATIANLSKGALRLPVISYNQEIDKSIREKFYGEFGSPLELYLSTGTPPYGQLLNAGIQIYWIRECFKEAFNEIDEVLFLPQYLTYMLSGFRASEITSIGCHTYLYDVRRNGWSHIAENLMFNARSPRMVDVWGSLGEAYFSGQKISVSPGIHDSNACLLPYLIRGREFLLASTGTWCVFMHPGEEFSPKSDDLHRDVLYYIDPYGRPVRSSRFKGGFEYDYYTAIIRGKFFVNLDNISFDENILNSILTRREDFIAPGLVEGSGQFQRSKARIIGDSFNRGAREAYHLLNLYLAVESYVAINLIAEKKKLDIVVQGGFAKNNIYLSILSALFPESRILKSSFPEATGLGAAICAECSSSGIKPHEVHVGMLEEGGEIEIPKPEIDADKLMKYVDEFVSRFSGEE